MAKLQKNSDQNATPAYTFITKTNSEDGPTRYFAIDKDRITTLRVSQTLDGFGNAVGTYNAGDSIVLLSSKAVEVANRIAKDQDETYNFTENEVISGNKHSDVFDLIEQAFGAVKLVENQDYELHAEECKGFDYHDGNNWRTVVTENENTGFTSHEVVEDAGLTAELNEAIDSMQLVATPPGGKTYQSGPWTITKSFWAGTWANYEIVATEEL